MQTLSEALSSRVAPTWTLPQEADPANVEMDFVRGDTVTGDDLEKTPTRGGCAEFSPKIGPDAPEFVGSPQIVELTWDPPGDRAGRSEVAVVHAPATLAGRQGRAT
jgi:hypothetical protein